MTYAELATTTNFSFLRGASHPEELVREAEALRQRSALHWQDWSRFSSRQQREMTLGGVLGEWTLEGDLSRLFPWLWLGQWLHVGKNATMGMGRYEIQTPCQ